MKKTNRIILYNIISTILVNGIAFISAPIFTRMLGTDNYGVVAICSTWGAIAVSVFGLEVQGSLAPAKNRFSDEEQSKFRSSIMCLATFVFSIMSVLIIVLYDPISSVIRLDFTLILLVLAQAYGQICVKIINSIYVLDFKAKHNLVLAVIVSVGTTVLSWVLIGRFDKSVNYYGRVLGLASVYFIVGIIICIKLVINGRVLYNQRYWSFALKIGIPYVFHGLASNVLGQSDRVMLQRMVSDSAVGIYSFAASFGTIINTIMYAFTNSWVPFFYEDMKNDNMELIRNRANNCIELFSVLTLGFVLLTPEVFAIIANDDFFAGCSYIAILVVGNFMDFLYLFPANVEMHHGRSDIVAKATTYAALLNIILNFILIGALGTIGAVISTAISHFFMFLFHYFSAKRLSKERFPFYSKQFVVPILIISIMCLWCSFVESDYFVIRWLIGGSIGLIELYRIVKRGFIF